MARPFESRIQDIVYNVEVGFGLRVLKWSLYLLGVLVLLLLFTVTQFKGLREARAMEYAQLGRNLSLHRRMVTQIQRPAGLHYLARQSPEGNARVHQHPDLLHPPLYPLLLATGFHLTGSGVMPAGAVPVHPGEQWVIVPLGHLFTLLTALMLFILGHRLFDPRVALLGVTIYFLSLMVWQESIAGIGMPVLSFLATLAYTLALTAAARRREGRKFFAWMLPLFFSAAVCALAVLMRYGAFFIAVGVALFLGMALRRHKGWLLSTVFLLLVLAGLAPWLVRNVLISGQPLGLALLAALEHTSLYEGDSIWRTLQPEFTWAEIIRPLFGKWVRNLRTFYHQDLRTLGEGLIAGLFAVTFFHRFVRERVHLLRWSLLAGIAVLVLTAGFFGRGTLRMLFVFWPFMILYAVAYLLVLIDRLALRFRVLQVGIITITVLLSAVPLGLALMPPRPGPPYPPYHVPYIQRVSNLLAPEEYMVTDIPWATAWYGQRDSLLLPKEMDDFYRVHDELRSINGLYFTQATRNLPFSGTLLTGPYRTWFPVLQGRLPENFPLPEGFPIGRLEQLFLSDRVRWEP